jgi:threonine/homoserine/homoserine lactone efflux protein
MDKKLCIASMVVAGVMLLIFLLDLIVGLPFGGSGPFVYIDIFGMICAGVLLYMGFHAWREVR